jgi:hypothetical protein
MATSEEILDEFLGGKDIAPAHVERVRDVLLNLLMFCTRQLSYDHLDGFCKDLLSNSLTEVSDGASNRKSFRT